MFKVSVSIDNQAQEIVKNPWSYILVIKFITDYVTLNKVLCASRPFFLIYIIRITMPDFQELYEN